MFINIKLGKLFKIFFVIILIVMLLLFVVSVYKTFTNNNTSKKPVSSENVIETTSSNYTNVLKTVHENIDKYVGKCIHLSGYVYRVLDLKDTQFVLARNMIISSDNKAVVVGFLCNYNNIKDFNNGTWVDVIGTITKGDYHGDMPIVEVKEINLINCPNDEFVYPPSETFVPTNSIV